MEGAVWYMQKVRDGKRTPVARLQDFGNGQVLVRITHANREEYYVAKEDMLSQQQQQQEGGGPTPALRYDALIKRLRRRGFDDIRDAMFPRMIVDPRLIVAYRKTAMETLRDENRLPREQDFPTSPQLAKAAERVFREQSTPPPAPPAILPRRQMTLSVVLQAIGERIGFTLRMRDADTRNTVAFLADDAEFEPLWETLSEAQRASLPATAHDLPFVSPDGDITVTSVAFGGVHLLGDETTLSLARDKTRLGEATKRGKVTIVYRTDMPTMHPSYVLRFVFTERNRLVGVVLIYKRDDDDEEEEQPPKRSRVGACAACGKEDVSKRCAQCGDAYYCNARCQIDHWGRAHHAECAAK